MNEVCPVDRENPYDNRSIDRAIHIWADRGINFDNKTFAEDYDFQKLESTNINIVNLRRYLMLDSNEWYLGLAQIIISAFPGILGRVKNNIFSKQLHQLPKKNIIKPQEIDIVNDGNEYSFFKEYDDSMPIPTEYKVQWSSEDMVNIETDTGISVYAPVTITSSYGEPPEYLGHSIIRSRDWGSKFPFKGSFKYNGFWNLGTQFTIKYFPPSINHENWIKDIEDGVDLSYILTKTGLFENYSLAKEPLEKLAILYSSLILNYDSEIQLK